VKNRFSILPFSVLSWLDYYRFHSKCGGYAGFQLTGMVFWNKPRKTWAIIIEIIALLIAILVVLTRKDIAYGLVVIWALLGIAVKQSANQKTS
jgi:asparagine N-glycosylation enzyme membrane subunit Stt3